MSRAHGTHVPLFRVCIVDAIGTLHIESSVLFRGRLRATLKLRASVSLLRRVIEWLGHVPSLDAHTRVARNEGIEHSSAPDPLSHLRSLTKDVGESCLTSTRAKIVVMMPITKP